MDLSTIQPAIKNLIGTLTGLDAYFEDDPRDVMVDPSKGAICLLKVFASRGIGWDERVQIPVPKDDPDAPPDGQDLQDEWRGQRQFTLTIKVESYDQTANKTAINVLEKVRNQLPFQSTRAALQAINVALVRAEQVQDLTDTRDDRRTSVGSLDLILSTRTRTLDTAAYPYLEQVRFLASLKP